VEPHRWQRLNDLFLRALEVDPSERARFLEATCADDPALRREAASLLEHHARASRVFDAAAAHAAADALGMQAGDALQPGDTLGPYRIERRLGTGGMGVVYLAEDTRLGRRVALKAVLNAAAATDERRQRLVREAKAAAGLAHTGIARVYALEEFDGRLYIASEYVEGPTLREAIASGPLKHGLARRIGLDLARALAAAHAQGIVHRDLKPENLILAGGVVVKVLDFGLAQRESGAETAASPRLTSPGIVLGTPGYMSPEQLLGRPVDFRTDIFAFGIVMYECVAGRHPFGSASPAATLARALEGEPRPLGPLIDPADRGLEPIIARCLQKDAGRRYSTTTALVRDLERLASTRPEGRSPASPVGRSPEPGALSPLFWWRVHQVVLTGLYMVAGNQIRIATDSLGLPIRALFFVGLAAAVAGTALRLNLLFVARYSPALVGEQRRQSSGRLRLVDLVLAATMLAACVASAESRPIAAAALAVLGVAIAAASLFIEPATIRMAFRRR
jgi:serine/threonine protein kinase